MSREFKWSTATRAPRPWRYVALISVGLIAAYSYVFPPGRPGADQVPEALVHSAALDTRMPAALPAHSEASGIATAVLVAAEPADKEASSIAQSRVRSRDLPSRHGRANQAGRFGGRGDDDDVEYESAPPAGPLGLLFGFR
jgi:hypothetical protein